MLVLRLPSSRLLASRAFIAGRKFSAAAAAAVSSRAAGAADSQSRNESNPDWKSSRLSGFGSKSMEARLKTLQERGFINDKEFAILSGRSASLTRETANIMVENALGLYELPNAVCVNMLLNGRDLVVPMVVEEPSVVAACSNMSRLCREGGGFFADDVPNVMIGQIQVVGMKNIANSKQQLELAIPKLIEKANSLNASLVKRGGGVRGMEVRELVYDEADEKREEMLCVHIFIDCCDAMGANMINTAAEGLAPEIEAIAQGKVGLKILSNLADRRVAKAMVRLPVDALGENGAEVAEGIAAAYRFAYADPYRAATHNKGVMNGIDAVAIATGNDWRAIEAGAHSYAARTGIYRPLTSWKCEGEGKHKVLVGRIEVPLQIGVVGGTLKLHPTAMSNLNMMGVSTASEVAQVMAAIGLAQNMGALRALASEGIQRGHMSMHARSVAAQAGAVGDMIQKVASVLISEKDFSVNRAKSALESLSKA